MPKTKLSQRSSHVTAESDDDDTVASQTQSMTQAERNATRFTPDVIDAKVAEVVHYMLIMEQKKIPVKRMDINKHVLKDQHKGIYPVVMEKAKVKLKKVYGIELAEIQHGKQKAYILLNILDASEADDYIDSSSDEPKMGLLMVVLGLIFMSKGMMSEPNLWHTLKKLGINIDKKHDVFGDVKKLLTQEFVRQMYLEYSRIFNSDPPEFEFRWGARANKEISKRNVLEFVTKMYGKDMQVESWKSQYREVLRSEGRMVSNGQVEEQE